MVSGFWFLVSAFLAPVSKKGGTNNLEEKTQSRNQKPETRNQKP